MKECIRVIFNDIKLDETIQDYEIYPVVSIASFLFENDFSFVKASFGGGVDEISHTGTKAYRAEYTDFKNFCDNYKKDYYDAMEREEIKSGGWVSFLDYKHIRFVFSKDLLRIQIYLSDERIVIIFNELCSHNENIVNGIKNKIFDMFGDDISLKEDTLSEDVAFYAT